MAKTILIYASVPLWEYHHAESVELALSHLAQGDAVHILTCTGALTSCAANAKHLKGLCTLCLEHQSRTRALLAKKNVTWHRVTLKPSSRRIFPSFPSISALRDFVIDGVPHGAFVASQLVDNTRDGYPEMGMHADACNSLLSQSVALYDFATELIQLINVRHVYVWNGRRPSDGPVVAAARNLKVPFTTHVWDYDEPWGHSRGFVVVEGSTFHDLNRLRDAVNPRTNPSPLTDDQYKQGVSYLENLSPAGRRLFGRKFQDVPLDFLSKDKHTVAIFTSSEWEFAGEPTWLNRLYPSQWDGIREIVSDSSLSSRVQIVVRIHPNLVNSPRDSGEWQIIKAVQSAANPNVHFVRPDDPVDSYRLLEACDTVATFGSTVGVEAAWRGKPVILLGCAAYEGTEICYEPKDHSEVVRLLSSRLEPPARDSIVRYGYMRYARTWSRVPLQHLRLDEQSRVRCGDHLLVAPGPKTKVRRFVGRLLRKCFPVPRPDAR